MTDLAHKKCLPCEGQTNALTLEECELLLKKLNHWKLDSNLNHIIKKFKFDDYYATMAFVNAVAWIAHQENHHPDIQLSYNFCIITYSTHAIKGLSENDFICAAKIDSLI